MRNFILCTTLSWLTFLLHLENSFGCSVPFHSTPPSINEKVFHSDVVLSGKVVRKELDLHRSMFGSPVYKAQLKVYCIYKGESTPQNLTVSTVGDPGSNCPAIHLRVRKEYILMLTRTTDGRYVPTYFPESFKHETMTEVLRVCGVRSAHPILSGDERFLMSCGTITHGECIPHKPHTESTLTTAKPQISAPTTEHEMEMTSPRKVTPDTDKETKQLYTTRTVTPETTRLTTSRTTNLSKTTVMKASQSTVRSPTTMSTTHASVTKSEKRPSKEDETGESVRKYKASDPEAEPNDGTAVEVEAQEKRTDSEPKRETDEKGKIDGDKKREPATLDAVVDSKGSGAAIQISTGCVIAISLITSLLLPKL